VRGGLGSILRIARASFQERSRRYSLLVTIVAVVWFASICIPPRGARYTTVGFGDTSGVYNSARIGGVFALLTSVLLSLPGFYLVKNAIARDRDTGVGEVLAAAPVGTWAYLAGKTLGNFAYLSVLSGTLALGALVVQLARGEAGGVDLWGLWSPFLLIVAPVMAIVASLAVLFESIAWLRGSLGNVVFFFLWMALLVGSISLNEGRRRSLDAADLFGASLVLESMADAARPLFPDGDPMGQAHLGFTIHDEARWKPEWRTFHWNGIDWSASGFAGRAAWLAAALAVTAIAALFFDRFDEERRGGAPRRGAREGPGTGLDDESDSHDGTESERGKRMARATVLLRRGDRAAASGGVLGPLAEPAGPPRLAGIVGAELRVAIKGLSRWWFVVAAGLAIAGFAVPAGPIRAALLSIAWLWPLSIFSSMGVRAVRHGVDEILDASPSPLRAQLPGLWLTGVLVAALAGLGVALRLALSADLTGLTAWACGALFIPSAALALGVWSGGPRLFEVLYLTLWYAGPMNQLSVLDYGGFTEAGRAAGVPLVFLGIAAVGVAGAFAGRALASRR
jgi:hypothetical protein